MSIVPPFLRPGDCISIVAPARKVSVEEIAPAVQWLQSHGMRVVEGTHLYGSHNQFSGTDDERASDLQEALDNPEIQAIWCARGGYGCPRIIDLLDFSGFMRHPKWLIGFSDMTVLHNHINKHCNIATLHAAMAFNVAGALSGDPLKKQSVDAIMQYLTGQSYNIEINDRQIAVSGTITGGNLSILYSMLGSVSDMDTRNKILLIEDLDEYLYHIDRMMVSLKRGNKLQHLKALLVGGMNDMRDNTIPFGSTAREIIEAHTKPYGYPVIFDVPSGHIPLNMPIPLGTIANIQNGIITFAAD